MPNFPLGRRNRRPPSRICRGVARGSLRGPVPLSLPLPCLTVPWQAFPHLRRRLGEYVTIVPERKCFLVCTLGQFSQLFCGPEILVVRWPLAQKSWAGVLGARPKTSSHKVVPSFVLLFATLGTTKVGTQTNLLDRAPRTSASRSLDILKQGILASGTPARDHKRRLARP